MKCPVCGTKTTIRDSVSCPDNETLRKHVCKNPECGKYFFTKEVVVEPNFDYNYKWHINHRGYLRYFKNREQEA